MRHNEDLEQTVSVTLPKDDDEAEPSPGYDVHVGSGVLTDLGERLTRRLPLEKGTTVFLARDSGVPDSVLETAVASLDRHGLNVHVATLLLSESDKTIDTLEFLLSEMARARLERGAPVIALGGGILGDVAGFAAAIYRRGVPVVQCPTTLLSMVDASVGGKTGVNLWVSDEGGQLDAGTGHWRLLKNMVGSFHRPILVLADVATLRTLSPRELRCGLAECIKHGMIGADWDDPGLLEWTNSKLGGVLEMEPKTLIELVSRNVALKARVVAADERETAHLRQGTVSGAAAGRASLNLGHTFAHALESIGTLAWNGRNGSHSGSVRHGEAVSLGLVAACQTSKHLALCEDGLASAVGTALETVGLPTKVAGLPPADSVIDRMLDDKKVTSGRLRLVLPCGPGHVQVVSDPPLEAVVAGVESIRA